MPAEITLNLEVFAAAASLQCTVAEAATLCGCSERTLLRKFVESEEQTKALIASGFVDPPPTLREIWNDGQAKGRASLRRRMVTTSMLVGKHSRTAALMQIHLSKHWLGMRDHSELSGPNGGAIPLADAGEVDLSKLDEMTDEELSRAYAERMAAG
jgi:hypothetical protein